LTPAAIEGILSATTVANLDDLEALLGSDDEAVKELRCLFRLMEAYGFAGYLQFDASCVRGLAYYTGGQTDETRPPQRFPQMWPNLLHTWALKTSTLHRDVRN
jgi:hypothetical protein